MHKKRFTSSPRVKLHQPSGRATLSGLSYQHLGAILNQAWLYCDEQRSRSQKDVQSYYIHMAKVIQAAQASLKDAISATHPKRVPTVEDRKRAVTDQKNLRQLIEGVLAERRETVEVDLLAVRLPKPDGDTDPRC